MLRCSDNSLYTGITIDLENRIKVHNEGKGSKYVKSRLPATLAYVEHSNNRSEASKTEARFKKLSKSQKEAICKRIITIFAI
jgi:predicted GIY-YIG superfamily endonuclease